MALLHYLKPVSGLRDPRGSPSSSIPAQAIAEVNKEVTGIVDGGKRGSYKQYSSTFCAEIAKYACQQPVLSNGCLPLFLVDVVPSNTRLLNVFIASKVTRVKNFQRVKG